jgi:uncharacterized membrane protein YjgN (DUF898 family)
VQSLVAAGPPVAEAAPPEAAAPAVPIAAPPQVERFAFSGKAGEYFGIWVVNLFLSIVTLGVYSAWAKVRRKRYFYGNTWLAGANFDYHGQPVAILKGRAVAFVLFVAYTLAGQFSPRLAAVIALALLPLVPWFIVRSLAFNAANSSHRNLHFHFSARYRDGLRAVLPLFVLPIFWLLMPEVEDAGVAGLDEADWLLMFVPTLAFAVVYPYVVAHLALLRANHSRYGTAGFECGATVGAFYWIYIVAAALLAGAGLLFWQAMEYAFLYMGFVGFAALPLMYVVLGAIVFGFTQARVGNLVLGETRLAGGLRLRSTLGARRLAWFYATNAAAIIATLGLAIPWAAMRTARYRAECLALECPGGLESFAAGVAMRVGAAGEEIGEMFDVDLSL